MNFKNYFNGHIILINNKKIIDKRGSFFESYNSEKLNNLNVKCKFYQDNVSISKKKGTLRGLHYQKKPFSQNKLITVVQGKIQDVVIDLRKKSKTFGKYQSFIMSENKSNQLYISNHFAHGFLTLENNTIVTYKVDKKYSKKHEITILWSDKKLKIKWLQKKNLILSEKDKLALDFIEIFKEKNLYL
jgi:dTDP-4-dehydrorhamnose 3,5-epimerase